MSPIYEALHRIAERLVAGETVETAEPEDGCEGGLLNDKTRAAFIRGMEEELEPPGKP